MTSIREAPTLTNADTMRAPRFGTMARMSSRVRSRPVRAWLVSLCALGAVAASREAHAQQSEELTRAERDELARAHFRAGARFFDQRRFAEAAGEFELVFEMSGQGALLFNAGRAWEAAGRPREAIRAYRRFLETREVGAARGLIEGNVRALEQRVADEERAAAQRASAGCVEPTLATPSGATRENASTTTTRDASAAPSSTSLMQLQTRVTFQHRTLDAVAPWVLFGIAGVTGGIAAWQGASALSDYSRVRDANTWSAQLTNSYYAARDEGNTAIVFSSVAGSAALGGVLWLIARGRGERREELVRSATLSPIHRGIAATMGGTF